MTIYDIHDNGSRPFEVQVMQTSQGGEPMTENPIIAEVVVRAGRRTILTIENCNEVFVGIDPTWPDNERLIGNTVLLKPKNDLEYIAVMCEIYRFKTETPIEWYESHVGGNDWPYPIATTADWIYMPLEHRRAKRAPLQAIDDVRGVYFYEYGQQIRPPGYHSEPYAYEVIEKRSRFERFDTDSVVPITLEAVEALMARAPETVKIDEVIFGLQKSMMVAPPLLTMKIEIMTWITYQIRIHEDEAGVERRTGELALRILWNDNFRRFADSQAKVGAESICVYNWQEIMDVVADPYRPFFEWINKFAHLFILPEPNVVMSSDSELEDEDISEYDEDEEELLVGDQ